jgi:hypothetical protein
MRCPMSTPTSVVRFRRTVPGEKTSSTLIASVALTIPMVAVADRYRAAAYNGFP